MKFMIKGVKIFLLNSGIFFLVFPLVINGAQTATLSLSPASGSYTVGDTFNIEIKLDTGGNETRGVDIHYLNYPSSLLEAQSVSAGNLYTNIPVKTIDVTNGRIDFSQTTAGSETFNGQGVLAIITFKVLAQGTANVTFDFIPGVTTETNVAANGTDVLASVTNGSYTLTSVTSPPPGSSSGGTAPPSSSLPPTIKGDFNNDGKVNIFDLSILLSNWKKAKTKYDLNKNGIVDIFDLSILLSNWTR